MIEIELNIPYIINEICKLCTWGPWGLLSSDSQGSEKALDVHQIPNGVIVSSAALQHHTGSVECLSA